MDTIFIQGLELTAIIGTLPHERIRKQRLKLDVEISGDFSAAGRSDDLNDALNYRRAEECIIECVENSSFFLLEALAENIAEKCLAFPLAEEVVVTITKPAAALRARSIALRIKRRKEHHA